MNVIVVSNDNIGHRLCQKISNDLNDVYYYGGDANKSFSSKYKIVEEYTLDSIIDDFKTKSIDFVIFSGTHKSFTRSCVKELNELNIGHFVLSDSYINLDAYIDDLEEVLKPKKERANADRLFEKFRKIPKPFVIKLLTKNFCGRETMIIDEINEYEIYHDLFSHYLKETFKITNVTKHDQIILEEYIPLKNEFTYYSLITKTDWKFLGAAKNIKKSFDGNQGVIINSAGSHTVNEISDEAHRIAELVVSYIRKNDIAHTGFLSLKIGITHKDEMVLLSASPSVDEGLLSLLETIDSDILDIMIQMSVDGKIPDIKKNSKASVTVSILNRIQDWSKPPSYMPVLNEKADVKISYPSKSDSYFEHSFITTNADTLDGATEMIYSYLDSLSVGQFYYRRDIGS